ncbi:hypothetical protein, partial [Symmachiella dynata]|uniref:hypothetical protein n=1 Tax=Symmachiella dynata TaxID=2527995 RepID=UPI0030ED9601
PPGGAGGWERKIFTCNHPSAPGFAGGYAHIAGGYAHIVFTLPPPHASINIRPGLTQIAARATLPLHTTATVKE